MLPIDPITRLLQRHYANLQNANAPAASDATAVAVRRPFRAPAPTSAIRAAVPSGAQPTRGLLGAVLGAGESVRNGIVSRRQAGLKPSDYISAALLAAGPVARSAAELATGADAAPIAQQSAGEFYHALMAAEQQASPAVRARTVESLLGALPRDATGPAMSEVDAALAKPWDGTPPVFVNALPHARGAVNPMLSNMAETGFANLPMTPESVLLPASGAGRAGSTASAVARAKQAVGPARLKAMAQAELAARGGTTPEAQMAAMEQVARNVASEPSKARGLLGIVGDSAIVSGAKRTMNAASAYGEVPTPALSTMLVHNTSDLVPHETNPVGMGGYPKYMAMLREQYGELQRRGLTDAKIAELFAQHRAGIGADPAETAQIFDRFRAAVGSLAQPKRIK